MRYLLFIFLFFASNLYGQLPATGGYLLKSSNGSVSIGTVVNTAPLTVANFETSFPNPQTGTMIHVVSDAVTNGRVSFDTYNNSNFTGSNYQGRRARGTAALPTAPLSDDILVAMGGDGYGDDSFTGASVGSVNIRAEAAFTNASKPTYISFTTTPSGSTTQAERLRIASTGQLTLFGYGGGTFTGTATKALQVDASGNIIEGNLGGSASWGSITGTLSSQTDLQTALDGKLATNGNGSSLTGLTAAQVGLGNVTNESKATMFTSPTFTGNAVLGTPASGNFSTGTFTWPTFNQNTTGSAASLTTSRKINGVSFNGTADIATQAEIQAYQAGGSPILAETLNFPLFWCNTATALVDNTVRFVAVWLPKDATLTGIRVYVRTAGNYTGDQNNRVGLYTYSGGTLTLVASSTNTSTLWTSSANAFQTIAFSSTYAASAGLYFVGLLYNQSAQTTAPALAGGTALNNVAMATMLGTNNIKFLGTLGAQNDLPSSQASSGITGSTASYWVALY